MSDAVSRPVLGEHTKFHENRICAIRSFPTMAEFATSQPAGTHRNRKNVLRKG